jgi:hypothetical protein
VAGHTSVRPGSPEAYGLGLGAAVLVTASMARMGTIATICLGCGDLTSRAHQGRCPNCAREYEARAKAKRARSRTGDGNRSERGKRVRAEHGAIVRSAKWKRIAKQVRMRDGNACTRCGGTDRLSVHHTEPARFADNPYDADYLVTLCLTCHGIVEAHERRVRASHDLPGRGGGSHFQGGDDPQGDAPSDARRGSAGEVYDTDWIS